MNLHWTMLNYDYIEFSQCVLLDDNGNTTKFLQKLIYSFHYVKWIMWSHRTFCFNVIPESFCPTLNSHIVASMVSQLVYHVKFLIYIRQVILSVKVDRQIKDVTGNLFIPFSIETILCVHVGRFDSVLYQRDNHKTFSRVDVISTCATWVNTLNRLLIDFTQNSNVWKCWIRTRFQLTVYNLELDSIMIT